MTTYIYTLSDNTGVRYVGKTTDLKRRLKDHIKFSSKKKTYKDKWICSLIKKNELPIFEILDEVNIEDWGFYEKYWIAQFKSWGFNLTNGNDGGEGGNGFKGKKHTLETIEKCRIAGLNNPNRVTVYGKDNGRSILTIDNVKFIREHTEFTNAYFSRLYNVSKTLISEVRLYKKWKYVE